MVEWILYRRGAGRSWLLQQGLWLMGLLAMAAPGCEAPMPDVLVDADGNQIRRSAITAVVEDPELDEAEKRQALRDLGITDDQLIDALLQGGS